VVAQSTADRSKSGALEVQVVPVGITSSPEAVEVPLGGTRQFTATLLNLRDRIVQWEVVEPGGGSISQSGLYTAPAAAQTPATFHGRSAQTVRRRARVRRSWPRLNASSAA